MNTRDKTVSLEALKDLLSEQWSNHACLGYLLVALEDLKYSGAEIQDIIFATQSGFNSMTTKEAADYYRHSRY